MRRSYWRRWRGYALWGLVQADLTRTDPDLDAHPLVRERFGAELEQQHPAAFRAAHRVLFDWFRGVAEKEQPETLEELEPLYRAVGHGCRAGAYKPALEVYKNRINHDTTGYSLFQLGAYSSALAALAGFFPGGWGAPPVAGEGGESGLEINTRTGHILSQALDCCTIGQALAALGRMEGDAGAGAALDRAVAAMQRAGKIQYLPVMHLARAHHRRRSDANPPPTRPVPGTTRPPPWPSPNPTTCAATWPNAPCWPASCTWTRAKPPKPPPNTPRLPA